MAAIIAVSGGILFNRCFLDIFDLKLFKFMSFLGLVGSCWASCSCIRALATSEHALKYLSFSGGRFASLGNRRFSGISIVIVSVAMMASCLLSNSTCRVKASHSTECLGKTLLAQVLPQVFTRLQTLPFKIGELSGQYQAVLVNTPCGMTLGIFRCAEISASAKLSAPFRTLKLALLQLHLVF